MAVKNKVLISFYDEKADDIIFNVLTKLTRRRNFANKMKDMLLEHIKNTIPELFDEVERELNGEGGTLNINTIENDTVSKKVNIIDKGISGIWDEN